MVSFEMPMSSGMVKVRGSYFIGKELYMDNVFALYHGGMSLLQSRTIALGVISALVTLIWIWPVIGVQATPSACECLRVHFLNVGQGDAILIETPEGFQMLVDGGPDGTVLRELSGVMGPHDRTLDVVVATHPDLDHIGGLVDVLARYEVTHVLMTKNENDTAVSKAFLNAVTQELAEVTYAESGQQFMLGATVSVAIFSPTGNEQLWESNNASIVMQITYGDTSFMLTGDASLEIENHLVGVYGDVLQSDVLKLGHHGSKTSTSQLFLDTVSPQYAVVSAGVGNRYGHPHQEVMARVFGRKIQSFHTGTDGTVSFESDGRSIIVK